MHHSSPILAAAALLCACAGSRLHASAPPPPLPGVTLTRELALLGTTARVEVGAPDHARAVAASEAAVRALEAAEARLSTWRTDSELARLNATPVGEPFEMSPELARELARALAVAERSAGAFDPCLASLVEAWDLRGAGRVPSEDELAHARASSGYAGLVVDGRLATRASVVRVEEGGFGKGAALDAALAAALGAGATAAVIDLGGQRAIAGTNESRWVPIAHPERRGEAVLEVLLRNGSVATSGNSERAIEVAGRRYGHVLDPRTGHPAPIWGSATVVAPGALEADALSTAAYALHWRRAAAALDPVLLVCIVRERGQWVAMATPGLRGRVRLLTDDLRLAFWDVRTRRGALAEPDPPIPDER
jgi:thiamine biosynthesis lipoprotein